ncbi:MAG: hypothetical protein J6A59_10025, partial [Lachnospiraceae bacterium]|nr:hypothetical protein [Lachnospiraceae bacterium]
MKRYIILLVSVILISGCGNSSVQSQDYEAPSFKIDDNTITKDGQLNFHELEDNTDENNDSIEFEEYDYESEQLGVIKLVGSDNTTNFTILDNNIVYNDITYIGLYEAINNITIPEDTDKNTFINFIVKVLKPNNTNVYVTYTVENKHNVYGDNTDTVSIEDVIADDTTIGLDYIFKGVTEYEQLLSEYNEDISWSMQLYDEKSTSRLNLYGCSKYMFIANANDMTYDMSLYNLGDYKSNDESNISEVSEETLGEETETLDEESETEILEEETETSEEEI